MKREWRIILPIAVLVLILAVLSAPVSAQGEGAGCQSETKFNGTIEGDIYFEQQGYLGNSPMTRTFTNVPSNITIARVYTGIWQGSPGKGGEFNITIQNSSGTHTSSTYQACDPCPGEPCANYQNETCRCDVLNCSTNSPPNVQSSDMRDYITGCGVQFISYNATPYISAGSNTITVKTSCCNNCTCWDGRIYLIALLVVYEDSSKPEMTYWINEGCPYIEEGSYCDGPDDHHNLSIYFNGTIPDDINTTKYWTLGFPHIASASTMELNGNDIGYPNYTAGDVFSYWDSINTSWFDTTNHFYYNDTNPLYERLGVAVLKLSSASETGPDLVVTDIDVGTPRPNTNFTVNATIKNWGTEDTGGHFNVSLHVGGAPNGTVNVTTGLDAGNSTTVSFTNVNESAGCYSFKVFADCDNDITEAIETNNNLTVNGQVGYVIVVESDGDFEKLNTGSAALPSGCFKNESGTYYIQNLTGSYSIENCAGEGITIKNTNATFVINNCTIKNCTGSGVFLHDLKNGTINGSDILNNTKYGIEVGLVPLGSDDPEFVSITNNTIDKNKYGIELIGFNCTVKNNNTISNNTEYGIYLYGNNSNITDCNNIRNNTDYGVKLYNSYNNNIYCNILADNNVDYSARTSQAWDNGDNNWNSTDAGENYTGNFWKDWKDNSGYPCNYTIDGGSNVDKRPKGLYDFLTGAGEDKWAFKDEVGDNPPTTCNVPSTEFLSSNPDEYGCIETDNGAYQIDETGTTRYYAAHRFNFSIDEAAADIDKINVTWNGKGWHDNGGAANGTYLYICNGTGYEELANNSGDGDEVTLTGEKTLSISSYINAGNVTVLVVQKSEQSGGGPATKRSHIETDYVSVVVTP